MRKLGLGVLASSLILILESCNNQPRLKTKELIPEQVQKDARKGEIGTLVNFCGAHTGFGDIVGPLWEYLDLKKTGILPEPVAFLTDQYSEKYLQNLYGPNYEAEIESKLGVKVINWSVRDQIKSADLVLELFSNGRQKYLQYGNLFQTTQTVTLYSDGMHNLDYDYIQLGMTPSAIYFKPPGLGPKRSGIVENPEVPEYLGKSAAEVRAVAVRKWQDTSLVPILKKEKFPEAKLGLVYGLHNARKDEDFFGQITELMESVKKHYASTSPVILFSPNTPADIRAESVGDAVVMDLQAFDSVKNLENKVYVVSTRGISNERFTALLAISDLPVIVEGNSAVSTAIRLGKTFAAIRSPWNRNQIEDVAEVFKQELKSEIINEVYFEHNREIPDFDKLFAYFTSQADSTDQILKISEATPNFTPTLVNALQVLSATVELSKIPDIRNRDEKMLELLHINKSLASDEVMRYSTILYLKSLGLISPQFFDRVEAGLLTEGIDTNEIKNKMHSKNGMD